MKILHNKVSNVELKNKLITDNTKRITVSFYKYFFIKNTTKFRNNIYCTFNKLKIFGRIYIANEGINAQISIPENKFDIFKKILYSKYNELYNIRINIALDNKNSFWVLKVKVRPYIVNDGIKNVKFNILNIKKGKYLNAKETNIMCENHNTIFVDVRNYYEYNIGHFFNAINIPSITFRQQMKNLVKYLNKFKNKKIVLYCTGGIRCEKASAWLLFNEFKNIYQIEGGIIGYYRQTKNKGISCKFIGKNFVFDHRLSESITDDILGNCYRCKSLCDIYRNCINKKCNKLFIQCDTCYIRFNGYCSLSCNK
ncbi:MAG: rhodanese-related sulfurtransferase [Enterobacterales bacterium]